ncbi:hypothetical protein BDB01DRAFT_785030 [Pilobolus umbonatus]|nr:hypothetical protein BDB01DRAFT_785030 [Pilobolus umbonatus]
MSGHIVYACHCLNIKVHLSHKYYLDGHTRYRRCKFIRPEDPISDGWKFELGVEGVITEYPLLVYINRAHCTTNDWLTIGCYYCSSGDVYSIQCNNIDILNMVYPFDVSTLHEGGDSVVIHEKTVYGNDIKLLQSKQNFSSIFNIVLEPDLPIYPEDKISSVILRNEYDHLNQLLESSIKKLEEDTKKKIDRYKEEQYSLLKREKNKSRYDSHLLSQIMKEIYNTVEKKMTLTQGSFSSSGPKSPSAFAMQPLSDSLLGIVPQHSIDKEAEKEIEKYQFSTYASPYKRRRRSCYKLDEGVILNSVKQETVSDVMKGHFARRTACLSQNNHPLVRVESDMSNASWVNEHAMDESNVNEEVFVMDEDMDSPDGRYITAEQNIDNNQSTSDPSKETGLSKDDSSKETDPHTPSVGIQPPHPVEIHTNTLSNPIEIVSVHPSQLPSKQRDNKSVFYIGYDSSISERLLSHHIQSMDQ